MLTPERPAFDAITAGGMLLIALIMSLAWTGLLARREKRYGLWAKVVLVILGLACLAGDWFGWFARLDLLPPPFVVLAMAAGSVAFAVGIGPVGDKLIRSTHIETLVALQIFRLPLELLMLRAGLLWIMPVEFSILGYNFDLFTGLGALLISIRVARTWSAPIGAVWIWNLFGIVCLVVIGALAVLTSPFVHAFGNAPQHINTWVLYFPYSLLPVLLVSFAVLGHVLLTRKLLAEKHPLPGLRWIKSALRGSTSLIAALSTLPFALFFALLFLSPSAALAQDSLEGNWQSIDDTTGKPRAEIRITQRDGVHTGRIVRSLQPTTPGTVEVCVKCTDDRKDKPLIGLDIIRNIKRNVDSATWDGGEILDPDKGKTYKLQLQLLEGGKKLQVRGYVGPFFRNQIWLRVLD
jgi:uncharacterized protein (DUF2147 family)